MLETGYQGYLEFFVETKERINSLTDDLRVKKKVWRELVALGLLEIIEAEGRDAAAGKVDQVLARHFDLRGEGDATPPTGSPAAHSSIDGD